MLDEKKKICSEWNEKSLKTKISLQVTEMREKRGKASYTCLFLTMPHFSIRCPWWGKGSKVWQRRTETDTRSIDGVILHQNKNDCSFHSALDSLYTFSNPTLSAWTLFFWLFSLVTLTTTFTFQFHVLPAWWPAPVVGTKSAL